tara:strand:- start:75956 stop:78574 length:2619 start_codon:yes stop_codon:yes gene_type:complete
LKNKKRVKEIMKIIIVLSLIVVSSVGVKSQDFQFKRVFENQTLEEVLKVIETETVYQFSYSSTSIPTKMKMNVSLNDSSIESTLDKIFKDTNIEYEVIKNRVILKQKREGQTVRGKVIDRHTQIPIIGASVVLLDTDPLKGDATNFDGVFRIENIQVGRYTIQVTYLGYQNEIIPGVLVGAGQEVVMDIEIEESLLQLDEIQVGVGRTISSVPLNDMAQVSGRSFTVEETKRFPVSIGDPLRLASSFAGVLATDDGGNDIVVRGNSPRGLLWKLEGVEIPSPNHFSSEGTSTGAISMFSTQVISRSDFLTSAFPAQYGNATSGVFDIQLRNGNNEKRESTLQLGLLGVDVASEGPFSKKGKASYLFNYRYSTLSLLSGVGLPLEEEGERNVFQDLSFKLNFPTQNAGIFSIFGMGGLSRYEESNVAIMKNDEYYNMGVIGVNNKYILGTSAVLTSTISWSGTEVGDNYIGPINNPLYEEENSFKKTYLRASIELNNKFNAHHFLSSGVTVNSLTYNFDSIEKNPSNNAPFEEMVYFNEDGNSGSLQAFTSWKYKPTETLTFVNGLHLLNFFLSQETVVEPRSNLRWQFHPKSAVFAGFGLHSRIESLEYYFANNIQEDGSVKNYNTDLGVTRSRHYVAGFDVQLSDRAYLKTEFYYQEIFNVPVFADSIAPTSPLAGAFSTINLTDGYISDDLVNGGKGKNYGVEATIERKFTNNYYFLVNAMLYESKYQGRDGITRNTRYNGNFGYNLLAGKEFELGGLEKNRTLGLNLKLTHAGNKRYSPINLELSRQEGREVVLVDDLYRKRFPDYFRIDIQINYRKNIKNRTIEWRLDIQNVSSHNNVLTTYYDRVEEQIFTPEEKIFIPVLSYRVEF